MRERTALLLCLGSFLLGCMLSINLIALDSKSPKISQNAAISLNHQKLLVILVLSRPDNVAQRNAIRETWATETSDDSVLLFVLGKGGDKSLLRHEVKQFDDLLFVEVQDKYDTLTTKVLQAFEQVNYYIYCFLEDNLFVFHRFQSTTTSGSC
jgi:hypothetical protein